MQHRRAPQRLPMPASIVKLVALVVAGLADYIWAPDHSLGRLRPKVRRRSLSESRVLTNPGLYSDMGSAYADMQGPAPHMGANGGARYVGPFKCEAQRDMEATLMRDRITGGQCLTRCCERACGAPLLPAEAKLCTRCRSAIYCSAACQRAAWVTPHGVHGSHKVQGCTPHP